MTNRFEGRIALVTGGANGIGRASAIKFAQQGAKVAILDIEDGPLGETAELIRSAGGTALPIVTNMRDREAVKAAVDKTVADIGPIDLLLNNVGQTARKNASSFIDSVPETWEFVVDLNLMVTMYTTWLVVPGMRDRKFGKVVSISSDSTLIGDKNIVDYAAAKSGVTGFTRGPKQLPKETYEQALKEIPIGHFAEPEDIADAITFLASQEARCITGQLLVVNGGRIFY